MRSPANSRRDVSRKLPENRPWARLYATVGTFAASIRSPVRGTQGAVGPGGFAGTHRRTGEHRKFGCRVSRPSCSRGIKSGRPDDYPKPPSGTQNQQQPESERSVGTRQDLGLPGPPAETTVKSPANKGAASSPLEAFDLPGFWPKPVHQVPTLSLRQEMAANEPSNGSVTALS